LLIFNLIIDELTKTDLAPNQCPPVPVGLQKGLSTRVNPIFPCWQFEDTCASKNDFGTCSTGYCQGHLPNRAQGEWNE
jgi:hypothetical protein